MNLEYIIRTNSSETNREDVAVIARQFRESTVVEDPTGLMYM
jgi:hypothetical protein